MTNMIPGYWLFGADSYVLNRLLLDDTSRADFYFSCMHRFSKAFSGAGGIDCVDGFMYQPSVWFILK